MVQTPMVFLVYPEECQGAVFPVFSRFAMLPVMDVS